MLTKTELAVLDALADLGPSTRIELAENARLSQFASDHAAFICVWGRMASFDGYRYSITPAGEIARRQFSQEKLL
jgi:hypothetical protein